MAIELKQSLRLSQQLVITPQLQQAIRLLQLSRTELADLVQDELLENPVLEESPQSEEDEVPVEMAKEIESELPPDKSHEQQAEVGTKDGDLQEPKEFDWENYMGTYNAPGDEFRSFAGQDEQPSYDNFTSKPISLTGHLEWQLRMVPHLSHREEEIGVTLINSLDDNGYLTVPVAEIAAKNSYTAEEIDDVLTVIQEFDPTGVGARDLKECLLLQASRFGEEKLALHDIIQNHLQLLERKDFQTLSKRLKIPLKKVITLARIIANMEPKPGRPFGGASTQYITPDVYVYKVGDEFAVVLNEEGLPRLKVSNFYQNMMSKPKSKNGDQTADYVQEKLKSALWLIKSIHQRQRTLYRVSKCIVKFQREFLDRGISVLRPMILKDVAEEIGMHESTVSRATSNKYMHTPQGIFELKFFFNSAVASANGGQDMASESVKGKIKDIISSENAEHPYSDKDIVGMLKAANIEIARRTVAKYREMLGILPSSKRRQLYHSE